MADRYILKTFPGAPGNDYQTSNPMPYRAALDARDAWRKAKALELRGKAAGAAAMAYARPHRDPERLREVARENGKGRGGGRTEKGRRRGIGLGGRPTTPPAPPIKKT